jgi:hypothetical protein
MDALENVIYEPEQLELLKQTLVKNLRNLKKYPLEDRCNAV